MKYNIMHVTFWFDEIENIKKYINILDDELNDWFSPFNLIGVPSSVDPIIPRITATTLGGHTTFNMSKINVKISTIFNGDFVNDFDKCFEYVKEKAQKVFKVLTDKCDLNILYSAITINSDYEEENPIKKIVENIFNSDIKDKNLNEIGVKLTEQIEDNYYYITVINDAKIVSLTKKIESGSKKQNIIIPLIPEKEVTIDKRVISFDIEINDKYKFDKCDNYHSSSEMINNMFNMFLQKNKELSEKISKDKFV